MRKFAIATSEVQDDVCVTDAEVVDTLLEAQNLVSNFMRERVGDLLDIDMEGQSAAEWTARESAVLGRLSVETAVYLDCYVERRIWRNDLPGQMLVLSATIQEVKL